MNKKAYIAPEMEITEMESQVWMFSGSFVDEEAETQLGNERDARRGSWGNLWD